MTARSVSFAPQVKFDQTLDEAFPKCDHNLIPPGHRILVQMRTAKDMTAGGIALPEEVKDTITWNTQVGKLIAVGPVAFRNRETLEHWPEGPWAVPGDYIRVPKYGGDKFEVRLKDGNSALFVLIDDGNMLGKVPDPLAVIAFV